MTPDGGMRTRPSPGRPLRGAIAVLAGGLSTRMGRDKARVRLGRRTLLGYVCDAARATGLPVRIIRRDRVPRCGPLGGILTALQTSRADAELFLACDMPFVPTELLRRLLRRFHRTGRAVFTEQDCGVGFPCLIPVGDLATIAASIRAGRFSLQAASAALGASQLRVTRRERARLLNVNDPADLARARQWLKRLPPSMATPADPPPGAGPTPGSVRRPLRRRRGPGEPHSPQATQRGRADAD